MTVRLLLTGAAGRLGTLVRTDLGALSPMRTVDIVDYAPVHASEETITADLSDLDQAVRATEGVDTVLHLAGYPQNADWAFIRRANIDVTYNIFVAARLTGVRRVVFASTNRVISYYPAEQTVTPDMPPRPDGIYGVTKLFGEALGRLYADQFGIQVACLRIGAFRDAPETERHLANWVSRRDLIAAIRAALEAPAFRYEVFFAASANTRSRLANAADAAIGFQPTDDAEIFADRVVAGSGYGMQAERFHGGVYCPAVPLRGSDETAK